MNAEYRCFFELIFLVSVVGGLFGGGLAICALSVAKQKDGGTGE